MSFYLRRGLWKQVAADYAKAFDLGALSAAPAMQGVPEMFLYVGDDKHYQASWESLI